MYISRHITSLVLAFQKFLFHLKKQGFVLKNPWIVNETIKDFMKKKIIKRLLGQKADN